MKTLAATFAAVLLLAAAAAGAAQQMLDVRLVKLTSRGSVSPGLENVAAIIQRNLPYAGCTLVDQKGCLMPANATLAFKGGYQVIFKTLDGNLGVTIMKGRKLLLSTAVTLPDNTPVILGGFDGGSGSKHVFVLLKSP